MPIKIRGLKAAFMWRTERGTWVYVCKRCGIKMRWIERRGEVYIECPRCGLSERIGTVTRWDL